MAIQIPRLSADAIAAEAARISEGRKASGKGGGDLPGLRFYNLKEGVNKLRLLPPSISGKLPGKLAMLVYRHWQLPGEKSGEICIAQTYPTARIPCPIDPVLQKYTDLGVKVQRQQANPKAITNCYPRDAEEDLAQIVELPMGFYNWLLESIVEEQMMDSFFDLKRGVDVHILKSITKKGNEERTEYKGSWSPKGPSALHADPKIAKAILESCFEMTDIYHAPDPNSDKGKDILRRLRATANILDRRLAEQNGVKPGLPSVAGKPAPPLEEEEEAAPEETEEEVTEEESGEEEETEEVAEEEETEEVEGEEEEEASEDEEVVEEEGEEEEAAEEEEEEIGENPILANPNDKPPCFKHDFFDKDVEYEGKKGGYDPENYVCIMCADETDCRSGVIAKFPQHYAKDGTIIHPTAIKAAPKKVEASPAVKTVVKKAAPPPPPPPPAKKMVKKVVKKK